MNSIEVKTKLIELLQTLPVCKPNTTRRNFTVRCPYCGDSKTLTHGHFSILIDVNSDSPILYRCFKCNESGIFTSTTLEDLGLNYDSDLSKELYKANSSKGKSSYFKDKIKNYKVPIEENSSENIKKLDYINRRLGTNLSLEDCVKYKIILSFINFINHNNIPIKRSENDISIIKPRTVIELNDNYIGFLSSNNNKIIFRDSTYNQSGFFGRYYKITLDLFNQSPNTFYSLDSKFNLLYTNNIDIHIAEGTFDILGVYLNIEGNDKLDNSLFFANGGYGIGTIIKYLIGIGITTDINLHLYSDADKSDKDHLNMLKKSLYKIWIDNVYIHRNIYENEKDFGVSKDKIIDYSYKLRFK